MKTTMNANDGPLQNVLGSAFDVVKKVHDRLPQLEDFLDLLENSMAFSDAAALAALLDAASQADKVKVLCFVVRNGNLSLPIPTDNALVMSPESLLFSGTAVGSESVGQTITVTNNTSTTLCLTNLRITGEFRLLRTGGVISNLAPGATFTAQVFFKPTSAGTKMGNILVDNGADVITIGSVIGTTGSVVPTLPIVTISNGVIQEAAGNAITNFSPTSLSFANTEAGSESEVSLVTLSNTGDAVLSLTSITVPANFTQTNDCGSSLAAGASCTISVKFAPTTEGLKTGSLTVVSNAAIGPSTVDLSGTAVEAGPAVLHRLKTSGNQFVEDRVDGVNVRLKSVNWFGAESANFTPHGTWIRPWRDIIDQIASFGFNCIRFPFSGDMCAPGIMPTTGALNAEVNADLVGLSALEIFDLYIDYCTTKGIYVVLDHHRRTAGAGADGSPVSGSYTVQNWIDNWLVMANRYKDNPTVVGADVHNEPHDLTWDSWAAYVEQCGNAIHQVAPAWLIFVEGVGAYNSVPYWWGGQLQGVANRPITLGIQNRVVYSPHEYGQSVGNQSWLAYDGQTPPDNWPNNLYSIWTGMWGFIFEQNIAPIWVGEFGGFFGIDNAGQLTKPHGTYETEWVTELSTYLNGDFNNDGVSNLSAGKLGMSFAYWSYNPNSGDTGGLLQDDWTTVQTGKLAKLSELVNFNGAVPLT